MSFKGKKIESHFSFYFTIICLKKKKTHNLYTMTHYYMLNFYIYGKV